MKIIVIIFSSFLTFFCLNVSAQTCQFAYGMGGTDDDRAYASITDPNGNTYITGSFKGTNVDFDPSGATNYLSSAALDDIFITKFNSSGTLLWAKSIGGNSVDIAYDIELDANGNIYISGIFASTDLDLDPGGGSSIVSLGNGLQAGFFASYDPQGVFRMGKSITGASGSVILCYGLNADASGNVYQTGAFEGTDIDFDPGTGSQLASGVGGTYDGFVAKYDNQGNFVWVNTIPGTGDDRADNVETDHYGNVYAVGAFEGSNIDFQSGTGTYTMSSTAFQDGHMLCYDASGAVQWGLVLPGGDNELISDIEIDPDTNLLVTGYLRGTLDLDPGSGTTSYTSKGDLDLFVSKFDRFGTFIFGNGIGSDKNDAVYDLKTDAQGKIYLTGYYLGAGGDWDPGAGTVIFPDTSNSCMFGIGFDGTGAYDWSVYARGTETVWGRGIAVMNSSTALISGYFSSSIGSPVDFQPGAGTVNLSSQGDNDAFFAKYNVGPVSVEKELSANDIVIYPNPNKGNVNIEGWESPSLHLRLMGLDGRILASFSSDQATVIRNLNEILHSVPAGMYYLEIGNGSSGVIRKLIKE